VAYLEGGGNQYTFDMKVGAGKISRHLVHIATHKLAHPDVV
jgi:hypothetical protein